MKDCPQKLKEIAYFSLVRSFVDYASAVWDPHQKFNQEKLEMVQRSYRAARFVKSRYKRTDSVTAMLDELGWPILSKRRKDARLILFYKIINNLAQLVPHEHILIKAYEGSLKCNLVLESNLVLERVICEQLTDYIEKHNYLYELQSGFRSTY